MHIIRLRQENIYSGKNMQSHWTSKKQESVISERREQLNLFFEFANTDLNDARSDHLKSQMYGFLESMMAGRRPAIHSVALNPTQSGMMQELQKHLRERLKKIIHNAKLLVEMPLWTISGSLEFKVEASINRFHERFRFRKIKPGNELKALKRMVDLALIEIIRDLDFNPKRFRQCPRCEKFFYQPTEKERIYCSIRCGNAVRLQQFRKERRRVQGKKPK
jgi:endogenous inhibitor of DNA gyrase (YacG/DUF329 family)